MVSQQSRNSLFLGDVVPDFKAETTTGSIEFHKCIENKWAILFSHPADFTPVCTTELGRAAILQPEFEKRGVNMFALSCDDVESHKKWVEDINSYNKCSLKFPIIGDPTREIAFKYGMIQTESPKDSKGLPLTVRSVFVIGPDKKLKLSITYPASTGRNFDEVLRVIDSLQLTYNKSLATPVDWKQGGKAIIAPTVSKEDADKNYKNYETVKLPSGKEYLRMYQP